MASPRQGKLEACVEIADLVRRLPRRTAGEYAGVPWTNRTRRDRDVALPIRGVIGNPASSL